MRENAFGTFIKIAVLLWTALCLYASCGAAEQFMDSASKDPNEPGNAGAIVGSFLGLGMLALAWVVPAVGGLVLYLLVGRSRVEARPTTSSTSTTRAPGFRPLSNGRLAVIPLQGPHGAIAADLINQGLLRCGIRVIERAHLERVFRELDFRNDRRFDASSLPQVGRVLGLRDVVVESTSAESGPLYSYDHVNLAIRVVDVETGEVLWASRYGNPMWSSAVSTQGDVQRGASKLAADLCKDFG